MTNSKLKKEWWDFHKANPVVWKLFKEKAFHALAKGKKKISARLIIEVIRWEHFVETVDRKSTFKINNNYVAFYARFFMYKYPQHDGVFELRQQKSNGGE